MRSWIERPQPAPSIDADGRPIDVWVVWFLRVHGFSACIAAGLAIGTWFQPGMSNRRSLAVVALLALLAGWIWNCLFREPAIVPVPPTVFLAIALPMYIAVGLAWPTAMLLLFLAYWQMYSLLHLWPAIVVTATFTVVNAWAQEGFPAAFPFAGMPALILLAVSVTFGGLFAWFIGSTIGQSTERQNLIDELQRTRADLAASEREQGMLAERQRMAGDVHDTIAQEFTSILMSLEVARTRLGATPHDAGTYLDLARDAARHGLGESRRIVQAMRPELLTGRTLPDALETLATHWSQLTAVALSFTIDGEPIPIGRDQEVAVFRSLQESLTNIRKHAAASRVDVTLSFLGDQVILDVRDDGCGFEIGPLPPGVGLETMRERARRFGGYVDIETSPGDGVTISFALPVTTGSAT